MEVAPRGRILRAGYFPLEYHVAHPHARIGHGNRRHQCRRIRVPGSVEYLACPGGFHELAHIHHGHTITNVFDHAQIMGNKKISQVKLFLQFQQQVKHLCLHRHIQRLRLVPVIILSNKMLSLEDVKRLENHARVTFQSKGVWSEAETVAAMNRALFGNDVLPAHTSALVKRAVAYLHQNYARPLARWEIAEAIGVSEDYLTRVFNRELGLSPWDYLNRYRVLQAQNLLKTTNHSIGVVAKQVGFSDGAYFSRVFHKAMGMSPQAFRDTPFS